MVLRRLSSEAWHFSRMHADQFINDCAYGSIGCIIYICHMSVFLRIYVAFVTEGHLGQVWCLIVLIPDLCPLSYFISAKCVLPKLSNVYK